MNYWLVRASLRPSLHSKFVATIAVPSIGPRGLDVSLAACVPTFLASWLVCRHGILQILFHSGQGADLVKVVVDSLEEVSRVKLFSLLPRLAPVGRFDWPPFDIYEPWFLD